MQYSMFNLGRMRAGVLFVAAIAAFSARDNRPRRERMLPRVSSA
jgi:hypothetical protein